MKRKVSRRPVLARKRCPGKAGKRRTLRVPVPKVGDEVVVKWVDSGLFVYRDNEPSEDLKLKELTTHGIVTHRNENRIVVASEYSDCPHDIETQQRNVIWNGSILGCVIRGRAKKR